MLDHLFSPLAIGPTELPCRIVSTAHQTTLVEDHLPTGDFVAYQHARARGGAGLIVMEAVAIAPSGLLTAHTIGGYLDGVLDPGCQSYIAAHDDLLDLLRAAQNDTVFDFLATHPDWVGGT